jgi:hypothetical protein
MIYSGDDAPAKRPTGVSVRQAMWSWAVALALVLGLGAIFYGINARHNAQTAARSRRSWPRLLRPLVFRRRHRRPALDSRYPRPQARAVTTLVKKTAI